VPAILACALSFAGCEGSGGGNAPPDPVVTVTVSPGADTVTTGLAASFTATVSGTSNGDVAWAVSGGAGAGSVSSAGLYVAGGTTGVRWVVATSVADPDAADSAEVLVVGAPVATVTAPVSATQGEAGLVASVPAQAGMTYAWTVVGGVITAGAGTRQVTFTASAGATVQLGCTVTNLAGTAAQGTAAVMLVAPPVITRFTADRTAVTFGQKAVLTAVFGGGSGEIAPGVGPVTSGVPVEVTPLAATTDYVLTVAGTGGATATASVQVAGHSPPSISRFDPLTRKVAPGDTALLVLIASVGDEGTLDVSPMVGQPGNLNRAVVTPPLASTTQFTLTATNAADSAVTDTATVTVANLGAGAYRQAGTLGAGRSRPALARLHDGRVLIAGGAMSIFEADLAVWEPTTELVTPAGDLADGTGGRVAVTLADGRVMLAGSGVVEVFDPSDGSVTVVGGLVATGIPGQALQLTDGRVLIASQDQFASNPGFDVYDPVAATVEGLALSGDAPPSRPRVITELADGRVLLGGWHPATSAPWIVLVDPVSGTSAGQSAPALPRFQGSFAALGDGRVLVFGGNVPGLEFIMVPQAEVFDPATGAWSPAGAMAIPRSNAVVTTLDDGRVLIQEGITGLTPTVYLVRILRAEVFDPLVGDFMPADEVRSHRNFGATIALPGGRALRVGGRAQDDTDLLPIELFE
jgi:hypothetical protein